MTARRDAKGSNDAAKLVGTVIIDLDGVRWRRFQREGNRNRNRHRHRHNNKLTGWLGKSKSPVTLYECV